MGETPQNTCTHPRDGLQSVVTFCGPARSWSGKGISIGSGSAKSRVRVAFGLLLVGALVVAAVLLPGLAHSGVQAAALGSPVASTETGPALSLQGLGSQTTSTGTGRIVVKLVAGVAPDFSTLGLREIDSVPGLGMHVLTLTGAGSLGADRVEAQIATDLQAIRLVPGVVWAPSALGVRHSGERWPRVARAVQTRARVSRVGYCSPRKAPLVS